MATLHAPGAWCRRRSCCRADTPQPPPRCVLARTQAPEAPVRDAGWLWNSGGTRTRDQLAQLKAKPKKGLGQNFVTDKNVLARIVRATGVTADDLVLEIGPGTGNLTHLLLETGATVLAVENDYTFAGKLAEVYATQPRFAMQQGDILRVDLPEVIEQLRGMAPNGDGAGRRVKIVANLPYNITTEILKVLLSQGDDISHIAFMLQHEVAQRLSNPHPDGAAYRTMTVVTHFFSHPEYLFKIDRQCYLPAPAVHGALAMFTLKQSHERPPVRSEREFRTFVQRAFSGKRKMITNSLAPQWAREDVERACAAIGVSPEVRPQNLHSSQFVELYQALCDAENAAHVSVADDELEATPLPATPPLAPGQAPAVPPAAAAA